MKRPRPLLILALIASVLALAACGDDDTRSDPSTAAPSGPAEAPPAPTETQAEGGDPKDLDNKPRVDVPKGDPPKKLVKQDIVKGKGTAAKKGDQVEMQYVGVLYEDGTEFDASWNSGQAFPFELGGGQVIKGWDQGIVGMKKGGRRKLVIPPDLAYGPEGQPPTIPPNATLVFVVDLIDIK